MSRKHQFLSPALGGALLLASAALSAEAPLLALPESPAWQHSRAFVEAYNAGDGAALSRYFATRLSDRAAAEQAGIWRAAELQKLRNELGAIEVIEASGVSHVLVLNGNSRGGEAVDVVIVVNADDPARIDELRLIRAGAPDVALREAP